MPITAGDLNTQVGGTTVTGNGKCYDMLGRQIACAYLDPTSIGWVAPAAGVYIDQNGQPVIVTGPSPCDMFKGCWGKQGYINESRVSVDYNTFFELAGAALIMGALALIFW